MKLFSSLWDWLEKKRQRHEMKKKGLVQSKKKKRLTQEGRIGRAAEESKAVGLLILFTVWCFCVAVLVMPPIFEPASDLVKGKDAPHTIYAEFDFSYINESATMVKKQQVLREVPFVYKLDYETLDECMDTAKALFNAILQSDEDNSEPTDSRLLQVYKSLPENEQNALLVLLKNQDSKKKLQEMLQTYLYLGIINKDERFRRGEMKLRIHKENIKEKAKPFSSIPIPEEAADNIAVEMAKGFSPENRETLQRALQKILDSVIKDDLILDKDLTDRDKQVAAAKIPPVKKRVRAGDVLVAKGRMVNDRVYNLYNEYLKQQRVQEGNRDFFRKFFVNAFLCMVLMCLTGIYIGHIHPEIIESNHKMGLIATVVIICVVVNYIAIQLFDQFRPVTNWSPELKSSVLPLAMVSIILSPMLGLRVAHYAGLFVAIMAAMQMDNSFSVLINGMLLCGISGFVVRHKPNHRSYLLSAMVIVALGTPILSLIHWWAIEGNMDMILQIVIFGVVNGLFTAVIALVLLFFLEIIFQISSDMTLLLLCDYNHPLLKRLQLEAPGTYHHSLVVSTLAEHAAQAIHANPIRARVISLFHDIGKMVKPEYFTENQHDADSKHSRLNPRMSSLVILNHVKEGTDMALKHKLRKIIRDGIQQHHGTDLIFYFYNQALEEARQKNTPVDENDFRYPGPLPHEKEVVILSLADAAEAASRSLQKPTPQKIDALVWEIFRKRIRNGQLDDANLTFGELKKVRESFVATLTTMMHGRIAYPKDQEENDEDDLFVATAKIENGEKNKDKTIDS